MESFYIETYGCQMNVADSGVIAGVMTSAGYELTDDPSRAGVVLINACAVRGRAEDRVIGRLSELQRYRLSRPDMVIGLCGCMAKHMAQTVREGVTPVDFVASPDAYRRLPDLVRRSRGRGEVLTDLRLDRSEIYAGIDPVRKAFPTAWVTVQRGCDRFCSFCIVPFVRGRERSVPPGEIERQVRILAEEGVKEVTLLGQTVSSYNHGQTDFADLLNLISGVDGIDRIRFMSPHPGDFSEKLLNTIDGNSKVCRHIHLPLQSGSDAVLARMGRGHSAGDYLRLITQIRERMPDVGLTTDVLVGFCGETEGDHQSTRDLLKLVRFDGAFTFRYSSRDGTHASRALRDDVPESEKIARLEGLIELQEEISREINLGLVGSVASVLVEGSSKRDPGWLVGKTGSFKQVVFEAGAERPGDIVSVRITGASSHTLQGRVVGRKGAPADDG